MNQKGEKNYITYSDSSELPKKKQNQKKSINQNTEITKKSYSVHTYQRRKYILPSDI